MDFIKLGILINLFALFTIRARPKIFGVKLYEPMIWNFKLSILPNIILALNILLTLILKSISVNTNIKLLNPLSNIICIIGFIVWILLLPNSGYLITELNLNHRNLDDVEVPIWYDIISILSFAISGIVNTVIGIDIFQIFTIIVLGAKFESYFNNPATYKLVLFSIDLIINLLVSVGIYLGRNIRFNSWDVLNPKKFIFKLLDHFSKEDIPKNFFYFIFFHTVFFMIMNRLFDFKQLDFSKINN